MTANRTEIEEVRELLAKLPREEQLLLAEEILEVDRQAARETHRKEMVAAYEEMLAHEAAQRSMKQAEAARVAG